MASQPGREKTEEFEYDENRSGHLTIDADLDDGDEIEDKTRAVKFSSQTKEKLDDSDEEFWQDDEAVPSKKLSPIEEFLKKQLPFIFNLIHKEKSMAVKPAPKIASKESNPAKNVSLLHKLFPFLNKVSEGVGSKPAKTETAASKFPIKPIHVVVILGLAVFLFMDDEEEINVDIPEVVETSAKVDKPTPNNMDVSDEQKKEELDPYDLALNKKTQNNENNDVTKVDGPQEPSPATENNDFALPPETTNADASAKQENTQDISLSDIVNNPENTESINPVEASGTDDPAPSVVPSPSEPKVNEKMVGIDNSIEESPMISDENPQVLFEEDIKPLAQDEVAPEDEKIVEIDPAQVVDINLSNMGKDISTEILKDLEKDMKSASISTQVRSMQGPVAPPDYDSPGPGLVYNCKDGHWACVDKVAHGLCAQNYAWNYSKGIKIECYVQDLYEQDEICNFVQQQKINKAVATTFCNGQN